MVIMEDSGTCNSPLISLTALLEVPVVHLVCDNVNLYAILYFFHIRSHIYTGFVVGPICLTPDYSTNQ